MRNALLRRTAASRGHEILLTGETATRVAIKVLAGMAEGRGWNMGEEVGAQWETQIGDICTLPLSQFRIFTDLNLSLLFLRSTPSSAFESDSGQGGFILFPRQIAYISDHTDARDGDTCERSWNRRFDRR